MRVLVTGATGRVGANVVKALLDRGYAVRALIFAGDASRAHKLDRFAQVEQVVGDLRDFEVMSYATEGVEVVCHIGALFQSPFGHLDYFDVNCRGTLNVLEAARARAETVKHVIYASSDGLYMGMRGPENPMPELVTEADMHSMHLMPYMQTKWIGEHLCWVYRRQYALPITVLRFGFQIGIGEFLDEDGLPPAAFRLGGTIELYERQSARNPEEEACLARLKALWTGQEQLLLARNPDGRPYKRHYCDVRDTARGVLLTIEHRERAIGEVYTLHGPGCDWATAIPYLSDALGMPSVEATLTRKTFIEFDLSKIKQHLGYEPQHDLASMVAAALARRRGEATDWVPTGALYGPATTAQAS